MFDFLYKTDDIKSKIGKNFVGPDMLPHCKETLIAVYKKEKGSDGQDVELYCSAAPAQFFRIKALPGKNSIKDKQNGFEITTGSGMLDWSIETSKMIAGGMIGAKSI